MDPGRFAGGRGTGQKGKRRAGRRLVQSEDEFRLCINDNNKDEYAYQGLANL
jgi:hypothetical protein